jgi:photosynthetic reaction center cytochrome c subunit
MKTKASFPASLGMLMAASIAFALLAVPATLFAQGDPTSQEMNGKTAGEFYKNIKVIKDIPAIDVHPAMEYISVSLGVGCGYCHDVRHFDNDDKPTKRSARNMMQMMFALNATVFNGRREVTCYTCHRGAAIAASTQPFSGEKLSNTPPSPDSFPALVVPNLVLNSDMGPVRPEPGAVRPPGRTGEAKAPVTLPSVDEIFEKYTQALGGTEAIQHASTLVEKGTVQMKIPNPPGVQGPPAIGNPPAEIDRKAPDKALAIIQLPSGPNMLGYDGSIAWIRANAVREQTGGEAAVDRDWAQFIPGMKFEENHTNVRVAGTDRVGVRDAYVVTGVGSDGSAIDRLYFDTQTGLLLRSVTNMISVLGSYPVETFFEDYREAAGLQVPYTIREVGPEGDRVFKWDRVDVNAPVEDSRFTMPAPKPAESRPGL